MSEHPGKTVTRRIMDEVYSQGRLEVIDELYQPAVGARVRELVIRLRSAFPDLALEVVHLLAEEDKVACHWKATGTQNGTFYNVPPTGEPATFSGTSIYVFEAGKVASVASNWDVFGLLQRLRAALLR